MGTMLKSISGNKYQIYKETGENMSCPAAALNQSKMYNFGNKEAFLQSSTDASRVCIRMKQAEEAIENTAQTITEWSENAVRQIVERVTILSDDEVLVRIKGGAEIKQRLER